jgi:hypothetical protein
LAHGSQISHIFIEGASFKARALAEGKTAAFAPPRGLPKGAGRHVVRGISAGNSYVTLRLWNNLISGTERLDEPDQ